MVMNSNLAPKGGGDETGLELAGEGEAPRMLCVQREARYGGDRKFKSLSVDLCLGCPSNG